MTVARAAAPRAASAEAVLADDLVDQNFGRRGKHKPESRLTTINANPMASDPRCSAISSRASFQARVLSYLAIPQIYGGERDRARDGDWGETENGTPNVIFGVPLPHPLPSSPVRARRKIFLKREPANSPASRRENRVCHRGRDRRYGRLAQTTRRMRARHEVHVDPRRLVDAQQAIVAEVGLWETMPSSTVISPNNAALNPSMIPPCTCASAPLRLTTIPQSTAATTRCTRITPFCTETSTASAA